LTCLTVPIYLRGKPSNKAVKVAIKHYNKLGLPFHICGSEGQLSRNYCQPYLSDLTHYAEVPQVRFSTSSGGDDVLRKKFNDSINTHGKGYEWYCMMGADDLVSLSTFDLLPKSDEPIMAGVSMKEPLLIKSLVTQESFKVELRYRLPLTLLPGLNCFNRAAMELCNWKPYNSSGCETGAELYFREYGEILPLPGYVVMLKENDVLNSISHIKKRHPISKGTRDQVELINSLV
jgi:hypothetical protein